MEQPRETVRSLALSSIIVFLSLTFSIEIHELVHLVTARALGIPSHFLNLTAAGIPTAEVGMFSPSSLALMNGLAPIFSFVILGVGSYWWLTSKRRSPNVFTYFVSWLAIFNMPYMGLQMMCMGGPNQPNGTGNDFATVFHFFGVSHFFRASLAVLGYIVFVALQIPLKNVINTANPARHSKSERKLSRWSWAIGFAVALIGLASAVKANQLLFYGHITNGFCLVLMEFLIWGIAAALMIPWSSEAIKDYLIRWIYPAVAATVVLVPFGIEGNDFLTLWVFVLPMIMGGVLFAVYDNRGLYIPEHVSSGV